jgi:anion-transporting  ArsA/GET3 family ATPase
VITDWPRLLVVVGSGGVGKTTLAAALGLISAEGGEDTLVMTFDPSMRLKDALGVGDAARDREVEVAASTRGGLFASLLDARQTFDRLVTRYARDPKARDRILSNRYYRHLAGSLAGVLEYMAVERLFEVSQARQYGRIILDTPPARQALDFLEAPGRIIGFLDSGALKLALRPWFDEAGHLRPTARLGRLGRRFEHYLDEMVGLDLLRDMVEFFQAFEPLYEGFRRRATEVEALLRSEETRFVLVAGPGEEKNPDTMYFARRLGDAGYRLGPIVVNRMHPAVFEPGSAVAREPVAPSDGRALLAWLGERDATGFEGLEKLASRSQAVVGLPLLPAEPSDLDALRGLAELFETRLTGAPPPALTRE